MGITLEDLEDLKKKVKEAEVELDELKSAYRVMKRLYGITVSQPEEPSKPSLSDTGAINIDELALPIKQVRRADSLPSNVKNVIERLGTQEFTVNHIATALKQMGKASSSKYFKNRVSMAIRKLVDEGMIERVHKGKGSDPHTYQNKALNPMKVITAALNED